MNIGINYYQKEDIPKERTEDYTLEIDSLFNSVLDNYGIEKEWRRKTVIKNREFDSLEYVYQINLPKDLTVAEIVQAENYVFVNSHSKFSSNELKNYGKSKIEIYSANVLKFEAFLKVDKSLYRNKSKIAVLIKIDDFDETQEVMKILNAPFPLCIITEPSQKLKNIIQGIQSRTKGFSIFISDNIEDEKYSLDIDFNKSKLSKNIRAIVKDFSDAREFIIDDKSEIAKSMLYNFVDAKFRGMKKNLIRLSKYILLNSENEQDVRSRFKFYSAGKDTTKVYKMVLSISNFKMLLPEIKRSLQKGTKAILN